MIDFNSAESIKTLGKSSACRHKGLTGTIDFSDRFQFFSNEIARMSFDNKIEELKLELPPAPKAVGVYKPALSSGNLCFTSGHVPLLPNGDLIKGCVGKDADQEAGYRAARQCGLAMLATLREHLGSLDRVQRVIKLFGLVNCTPDFTGQPAVINGCSELFKDVFGDDAGVGTRSAVGSVALPLGIMVEIEAIFEIET
jgi:enamine deaminase RidA (YjgF/YER057c/UK114 family)